MVDMHERCSGLVIPALELREVTPGNLREAGEEILNRGGCSIAALEIEIHAATEGRGTDDLVEHADDFGALVVDGRRVEVVDLVIGLWTNGMGEGAGILGELHEPQLANVSDAFDGARAGIAGVLLVAEDGQAFLQ